MSQSLPKIPTAPLPLYRTMDSVDDVVSLAKSMVPITSVNDVTTLLFTYHNTLLKQLSEENPVQ